MFGRGAIEKKNDLLKRYGIRENVKIGNDLQNTLLQRVVVLYLYSWLLYNGIIFLFNDHSLEIVALLFSLFFATAA